jgi:hypothetical protein
MKTDILMALVAAGGFCCPIGTLAAEERVVIGQPTVFWHNGEWQTYKNGVWTPYGKAPALSSQTPSGQPNSLGAGTDQDTARSDAQRVVHHAHRNKGGSMAHHNAADTGQSTSSPGEPNDGIGQTTLGMGQTTIGIGQPTVGIGQTTIGIGQPTIGIGQPTIGIGQPTIGIGQTTIGIGQPNSGLGNPNSGLGQPNGIGQPTKIRSPRPEVRRKPGA